jgi:putative peptidoglycan lipid II flippase
MLPVILGLALPQVSTIVNKMFAASLGDGPQSALMNANRLMQVPLGIFAQATAIAIFPTLAAQAARKEMTQLRRTANFGIRSILFLTVPSSLLMVVLALPIVPLILHTGRFQDTEARMAAQNPEDTFLVDSCPLAVCHNQRAKRSRLYQDEAGAYWGYCAAKEEYF